MGLTLSKFHEQPNPRKTRYILELFHTKFDKADFNPTIISPYKCSNYSPKLSAQQKILHARTRTCLTLYRPKRIQAVLSGTYCSLMYMQSQKWRNSLIFSQNLLKKQKVRQNLVIHTVVKKMDGLKYAVLDEAKQGWLASCANDQLSFVDTDNRKKLITVDYREANSLESDSGFFVRKVDRKDKILCFYEIVTDK